MSALEHNAPAEDGSNQHQDGSPGSYLAYLFPLGRESQFFASEDPSVSFRRADIRGELINSINVSRRLDAFKASSGQDTLGGEVLDLLCALLCLLDDGGALEVGSVQKHVFTHDSVPPLFLAHKYQHRYLVLRL